MNLRENIYIPVVIVLPLLFSQWPTNLLMTDTVWAEARGESLTGKIAVAYVIENRVKDGRFGKNHKEVILARKQFSCFNTKRSKNKMRDPLKYDSFNTWKECYKAVELVLGGKVEDPTMGATHYHNKDIEPYWAKSMEFTKQIGNHRFYRVK